MVQRGKIQLPSKFAGRLAERAAGIDGVRDAGGGDERVGCAGDCGFAGAGYSRGAEGGGHSGGAGGSVAEIVGSRGGGALCERADVGDGGGGSGEIFGTACSEDLGQMVTAIGRTG